MPRVLVIDDDKEIRTIFQNMLRELGFDVAVAANGLKGLEKQRALPADILITDILMPEQDGIETIIEFSKEFPDTKIVAMSGGGRTRNMDFLDLAKQLGADAILAKPFTFKQLIETLESIL
ncbi:MAG: response regulator [Rhodospirillales bacterium]|nr:response regulator [Rhodospirillales bacterium]